MAWPVQLAGRKGETGKGADGPAGIRAVRIHPVTRLGEVPLSFWLQ
jgi:hypothetical protein